MGNKQSRQLPQQPPQQQNVEHSMQASSADFPTSQSTYTSLGESIDIDNMQKRREQAEQQKQQLQQPRQLQQQQPQGRYIGSTNVFVSTDNKFKFVVDPTITQAIVLQEENVGQTKKVPATQFNFFFVRHAKSCANEQPGLLNLKKLELDDPFISNDGIWATSKKKNDYDEFFKQYEVDHYFCTPLIRTWCTAAMLFPSHISDFEIAPHLREDAKGYTNHPYPYETNVNRFRFFAEYVKTLTEGEREIDGVPGYALMNKALANYGSDFVDQIGIELFMQWYIKNENILGRTNKSIRNVVVVCHSDILKTFCNAHLNENQLNNRGMGGGKKFFKETNNYCIQVQVKMPVRELKQEQVYAPPTESEQIKALVQQNVDAQKEEYEKMMARAQANAVSLPAAGGNKHKKTKKKTTRSTKSHNKKTRLAKQRGGGNKNFSAIETNLPFLMTITKAIDGTPDVVRDPHSKSKDCICYPDAYQNPNQTFLCAKNNGVDELRGFLNRQIPEKE